MADEKEYPVHPRELDRLPAHQVRIDDLLSREEEVDKAYLKYSHDDFMFFARGLKIASQGGPKIFEGVMADFQRTCFQDLAGPLKALRDGKMPEMRRFWIERTKKAGKDSDLAVILAWLLAFPARPFYGQVGAADREQAAIVRERLAHLLYWNKWLNDHIKMVGNELRSTKLMDDGKISLAKVDIKSSDVAGAHGGTPDILIINELSHITKWEFVENMLDNADGVAEGITIIATNAGHKGTPAEVWRTNAIASENWCTHILDRPAPWHTKETLKEAEKRDKGPRFARLWKGKWISSRGDALDEYAVQRCFCLPGPDLAPVDGWTYLAGLDLGISHDHSALMITGVNLKRRKIRTAFWKSWTPKTGSKVDLMKVETDALMICSRFNVMCLLYDPWQAELMAQRLKMQIPVREMAFQSTKNLNRMATSLIEVVESKVLECYDDEEGVLRRDLGKFDIVEKSFGYRLEAVSDEYGHADVGTALVITLPAAVDLLEGLNFFSETDDLIDPDGEDLDDEEVELMPSALREIYGMYDDREEGYKDEYRV